MRLGFRLFGCVRADYLPKSRYTDTRHRSSVDLTSANFLSIIANYCLPLGEATLHKLINHDEERIIEVKLFGLCSMGEFRDFTGELRAAIAWFPASDEPPATLYDFTDATIQTQEVVAAMKALAEHPTMIHRRVAMYTEGVLARRQALRISENRENMRVFKSRVEAIEWLKTG